MRIDEAAGIIRIADCNQPEEILPVRVTDGADNRQVYSF
jgi:hypothetical protein